MSTAHRNDRSFTTRFLDRAYKGLYGAAKGIIKPLIPHSLYRNPLFARLLSRVPPPDPVIPEEIVAAPPEPPPAPEPTDAERYAEKLRSEIASFKNVEHVHDLPQIALFWADTYLRPMFQEYGVENPDELFAKALADAAVSCGADRPRFVSIGSGNCDTEVRVAKMLRERIGPDFVIECLELNPHMLERGQALAAAEGVSDNLAFVETDFNHWTAPHSYCGVMANQSLHHVTNLEGLFDEVRRTLKPEGAFVISDMIGRNGHMRWPEALEVVHRFWEELPEGYRYNHQLKRFEQPYENWDCSTEGFEGIRAQDIMPLLLERFHFSFFLGFGNVIDVFIDRGFGHNFDPTAEWDKNFITRLHGVDEAGFQNGSLTPTHVAAVLHTTPDRPLLSPRGLDPAACVRVP